MRMSDERISTQPSQLHRLIGDPMVLHAAAHLPSVHEPPRNDLLPVAQEQHCGAHSLAFEHASPWALVPQFCDMGGQPLFTCSVAVSWPVESVPPHPSAQATIETTRANPLTVSLL
jgi:hypothetical protein